MEENFFTALGRLYNFFKLEKDDITSIYWIAGFSGLISLSLPLGIQSIVSYVMAGSISTSIIVLISFVILGVASNGFIEIKKLDLIEKIEQKLFTRYAFTYTDRLPKINMEKYDNYYLPELVNRFFDVSSFQKSIYKLLLDVPSAVLQIGIGTVLLAFYHPLFLGFGAAMLFVVFLIIRFTSPRGFKTAMISSDYKYRIGDWLEQISRNIRIFKYNNHNDFHLNHTDALLVKYLDNKNAHFKILKTQYWALVCFKIVILSVMLFLGVKLLVTQQINVGQFIAADIVILSIISSVEKFINNFDKLYEALTAIEKLEKVVEAPLEKVNGIEYLNNEKGMKIEFDNVSFSYNDGHKIINNISFKLEKGDWLEIKGIRRSGKTSILNLLSGGYTNYEGTILINELPINQYAMASYRKNIGIMLQDSMLLEGTIMENICLGDNKKHIDYIIKLSKLTGLWKYIVNLKDGFEYAVKVYQRVLSPEIINSILLTRALYNKPDLLLLEDPFTGLSQNQIADIKNYLKYDYNPTVIIVNNENSKLEYCNHYLNL